MLDPWKKSCDKPRQHIKKQRQYFPTKIWIDQVTLSPVIIHGYESWTIRMAECWRTDAFELWCWRKLLRVPWTIRRYNKSILKEISLEYSLEGLKLKLQCFCQLMWIVDSLEKTLMLGKIEGGRSRGQQRMRWLVDVTNSMSMSLSKLQEMVKDKEAWHGVAKSQTWLND